MEITKSRLKQIIKEEMERLSSDYESIEMGQVSDLERAMEIANELEQYVRVMGEAMPIQLVGELQGILADLIDSEGSEIGWQKHPVVVYYKHYRGNDAKDCSRFWYPY